MPPRPPRVLVAPNAFKGSCSAEVAARAMALGLTDAWPGIQPVLLPLADGGDGFLAVLVRGTGGRVTRHQVAGPLGRPHRAPLGWLGGPGPATAVVELASACGLRLVGTPTVESSLRASTVGLGQLIRVALDRGAQRLLIGVGGSASTDGGAGCLAALGLGIVDGRGRPVVSGGGRLAEVATLDRTGLDPRLARIPMVVAVDVRNPLLGRSGAARVYAPQKGADPSAVEQLEQGLRRWARLLSPGGRDLSPQSPGAGAAGGTAFGLAAGLGAQLAPGAVVVAERVGLDRALSSAGLVLTGEGRLDHQSLFGKATQLVAERAAQAGTACAVLCGSVEPGAERALARMGATALPLGDGPRTLADAVEATRSDLRRAAARAGRLWRAGCTGQSTGVTHSRYFSTLPRTTSK
ncbi:MAG TPA: glycerate kinase [Verrucomicrobiae bacterium]|nr:glycerate kinase [Verrucomicrobiae bacterium]